MSLAELRDLISLAGTALVLLSALMIPVYLAASRKPKKNVLWTLWAVFWRGPVLLLLGATLYPDMGILSAVLVLLIVLGPLELKTRLVGPAESA